MYINCRLVGNIAKRVIHNEIDDIQLDWSKFFYNLLFSDHFTLDSIRLREIPYLTKRFGFAEVKQLLLSPYFSYRCEAYNFGLMNVDKPSRKYLYHALLFDVADRSDYIKSCLDEPGYQNSLEGYIYESEKSNLIDLVEEKLLIQPSDPLKSVFFSLRDELQNSKVSFKTILHHELCCNNIEVKFDQIDIEVELVGPDQFLVHNNLESKFRLDPQQAHKIIGKCINALGRQHIRLFKMENDQAFGCYREEEHPFLVRSLEYFSRQFSPHTHKDSFERVIRLADLPQMKVDSSIKLSKLLKIRESAECMEFRKWLCKVPDLSDDEILKEFSHRTSRIVSLLRGKLGKTIGHVVNIGSSFLNPLPSLAVTYFPWIASKFTNPKGHVVFLYRDYQSIYD